MSQKPKSTDAKAKQASIKPATAPGGTSPPPPTPPAPAPRLPPLFRRLDWLTFTITMVTVMIGYYFTLAPDLTLEDSGELAVASFYAGVPHPPGYPVWTIYTWLFTRLPISNVAWRVALSSAVAGALACGMLALLVSRGSSLLLEGIAEFKNIERRTENLICVVSGFVAGTLLGFNSFMWSQAVIVEVYTLSVLSFMAVLVCLLRWVYAPEQRRYLYWAMFWFGVCFTNHQTLIVAAMGIEVAIVAAQPKLGRDFLFGNSAVFLLGLLAKKAGILTTFDNNPSLYIIYLAVGTLSLAGWVLLSILTRSTQRDWMAFVRDMLLSAGFGYVFLLIAQHGEAVRLQEVLEGANMSPERIKLLIFLMHAGGIGSIAGCIWIAIRHFQLNIGKLPAVTKTLYYVSGTYLVLLLVLTVSSTRVLNGSPGIFALFHTIGLGSMFALVCALARRSDFASEIKVVFMSGVVWLLGASFYFYMPLASMTNPPLNWGYPRTVEGFFHALTRGQYDKTNPTDSAFKFFSQMRMFTEGSIEEFSLIYLLLALIPFFFFRRMQKRERTWIIGLTAIFLMLSFLLMYLLNPNIDKQSRDLSRVFFTASHIILAILIGYGVTLIAGTALRLYEQFRRPMLWSGAIATAIQLFFALESLSKGVFPPPVPEAEFIVLGGTFVFTIAILLCRNRAPLGVLLAIFALAPVHSFVGNWEKAEEWGHRFGYWFGHDMFTPPFGMYPEMTKDTILFGGTDPGRFNPTYMIFAESFIPPECKPTDPKFDRRDVYLITQNALADKTYLDYIRAHYNRSAQKDPYFFSELVRSEKERTEFRTNLFSRLMLPVDQYFTDLGARIEAERRRKGVYPPKEILTPTAEDSQLAFQEYVMDAQKRLDHDMRFPNEMRLIKPGEDVRISEGKVQVAGQVAVMAINGLLTKIIFDKNPTNDFFVEESFPLDWMFPHLTPFGVIMKINRDVVPDLTDDVLQRDHEFWTRYSERLCGNWITYDTSIKEICDFAERTYLHRNLAGFKGDRKFLRDDVGQKSFSKLRSAIGGVYAWRLYGPDCPPQCRPKTEPAAQRLLKEAEFAFKQAYAFCPYSPEAVYKLVQLLLIPSVGRVDDAKLIVQTSLKFDPDNQALLGLLNQLNAQPSTAQMQAQVAAAQTQLSQLEQAFKASPTNLQAGFALADAYTALQRYDAAGPVLEQLAASPNADIRVLLSVAEAYARQNNRVKLDAVLEKVKGMLAQAEERFRANTNDVKLAFEIISAYVAMRQTDKAIELTDQLVARPNADGSVFVSAAELYAQVQDIKKLEGALQKLVGVMPTHAEAWYDLAAVQSTVGKTKEALASLRQALTLSDARRSSQPGTKDLRAGATSDIRFAELQKNPEFQKLIKGN